jgi:hypothetical protein
MLMLMFLTLHVADPATDLTGKILADRCRAASIREDEVVVCGRRDGQSPYRIGPQRPTPPTLPNAEFKISGGVAAKLSAEQGEIGGIPTNRALITLKIKF